MHLGAIVLLKEAIEVPKLFWPRFSQIILFCLKSKLFFLFAFDSSYVFVLKAVEHNVGTVKQSLC